MFTKNNFNLIFPKHSTVKPLVTLPSQDRAVVGTQKSQIEKRKNPFYKYYNSYFNNICVAE